MESVKRNQDAQGNMSKSQKRKQKKKQKQNQREENEQEQREQEEMTGSIEDSDKNILNASSAT